jgi:hypothetical protein
LFVKAQTIRTKPGLPIAEIASELNKLEKKGVVFYSSGRVA